MRLLAHTRLNLYAALSFKSQNSVINWSFLKQHNVGKPLSGSSEQTEALRKDALRNSAKETETKSFRNTFKVHLIMPVKIFYTFFHCNRCCRSSCSDFWASFAPRLKSALFLFFKDMQISPPLSLPRSLCAFYLHSNKLVLLNALERITAEVSFELIQRRCWLELEGKWWEPLFSILAHITVHYFI